jgi:hypothetical protein
MRKRNCLFIMSVFILLNASSVFAANEQKDFRKTRWGMNPSQVISSEGKKPASRDKKGSIAILGYSDQISGFPCSIIYVFVNDKLVRTKYVIKSQHINKNEYLSDYDKLMLSLSDKYGAAIGDNTYWKNDLFKDRPSDWGMAISAGHMAKYANWENSRTTIYLYLSGDNFEIEFGIEYTSKELGDLEDQAKREADKANF